MEQVFKCGDCGEVLSATALTENGGCRVVFHIQKHTCFGVDQEQEDVPNFSNITNNEEERGVK